MPIAQSKCHIHFYYILQDLSYQYSSWARIKGNLPPNKRTSCNIVELDKTISDDVSIIFLWTDYSFIVLHIGVVIGRGGTSLKFINSSRVESSSIVNFFNRVELLFCKVMSNFEVHKFKSDFGTISSACKMEELSTFFSM